MQPDAFNAAHAINYEGCEHQQRNDFIAAIGFYRRALALFEQAGDAHGRIMVLVNLGETYCLMNDGVQATRHLCQAQAIIDATPDTDPRLVGAVLGHRGWAAALTGNLDAAEGLLLRGLHAIRLHGDTASQKRDMLKVLTVVMDRRGDHAAVAELVRQVGDD
jgi:hypothetical protein